MASASGGMAGVAASTKNALGQKLKLESHLATNLKRKIKEL